MDESHFVVFAKNLFFSEETAGRQEERSDGGVCDAGRNKGRGGGGGRDSFLWCGLTFHRGHDGVRLVRGCSTLTNRQGLHCGGVRRWFGVEQTLDALMMTISRIDEIVDVAFETHRIDAQRNCGEVMMIVVVIDVALTIKRITNMTASSLKG